MLDLFCLLTDIEISYKGIERLYSDPEVELALHNLHILILKNKGVSVVEGTEDGTGYSLTISKHYASETAKRKDKMKEAETQQDDKVKEGKKKRAFVYSFKLLDLVSHMYVSFGMGLKSEKDAYEEAMQMFADLFYLRARILITPADKNARPFKSVRFAPLPSP